LSSSSLSKNIQIKTQRNMMTPVVVYGCETWSFKLREQSKLSVLENGVPWGIFRPKWDEVARERIQLHNEKFNDPYSSPNIRLIKSRRMRRAGHGLD